MKTLKHLFIVCVCIAFIFSCKNENKEAASNFTVTKAENKHEERTGQAFIKDDESTPNVLQIAMGSKDHTTLVAAIQAAQLENALVNAGPLMVFAPTNEAFAALP